jgi:hypothetical protein
MQRDNFIFTIGYKDDQAIVDKRNRAKYRKLGTMELFEEGLIKPAVASAIYQREQGDNSDLEALLERMRTELGEDLDEERLRRIYGITRDPSEIDKVLQV